MRSHTSTRKLIKLIRLWPRKTLRLTNCIQRIKTLILSHLTSRARKRINRTKSISETVRLVIFNSRLKIVINGSSQLRKKQRSLNQIYCRKLQVCKLKKLNCKKLRNLMTRESHIWIRRGGKILSRELIQKIAVVRKKRRNEHGSPFIFHFFCSIFSVAIYITHTLSLFIASFLVIYSLK
mgnify:CR=1 FL=1